MHTDQVNIRATARHGVAIRSGLESIAVDYRGSGREFIFRAGTG
jgi:hypothetical protein